MEYLKTVVPSQLITERGSNLVVISPGSANVRVGLAHQQAPFNVPHCIARFMKEWNVGPKRRVQDQFLNSQITPSQHLEREKAYDIIASLLKIPFLDEDIVNDSYPHKMGRIDGYNTLGSRGDAPFAWTDVREMYPSSSSSAGESLEKKDVSKASTEPPDGDGRKQSSGEHKFKEYICGEEALRISPAEPYCLRRPIRRGHLNISQSYPTQQVLEDLCAIWDWILNEKLHIPQDDRNMFSAIVVVPETFDSREIKEVLSIVLRDLRYTTFVNLSVEHCRQGGGSWQGARMRRNTFEPDVGSGKSGVGTVLVAGSTEIARRHDEEGGATARTLSVEASTSEQRWDTLCTDDDGGDAWQRRRGWLFG
ncbi:hypothetical protein MRB53_032286 [Persea americana]|uniref:Uncharacterized protein n=1 Tax=Persea americana TaxID=3435 RepID=A0ACC2KRD3_PERAE|nr:hypothetical protein MRB53_032286 [Persea americana]